jgi:transcriptional regulator with XRE-family HTH domain
VALRNFTTLDDSAGREWTGDRLRELRRARHLRLEDLARFAGLTRQRLGQIEAAAHPSDRSLQNYFRALNRADLASSRTDTDAEERE